MITLDPPRWKNGPLICPHANLAAFATMKEAEDFLARTLGSYLIKWECAVCGCWHVWSKPQAISGATSGTSRPYAIPAHIQKLYDERRE